MAARWRNSERTRSVFLEKTAPLFNTRGYHKTSLQDITKATGMTKGALYGNYENKDALAIAAFEYMSSRIIEGLAVATGQAHHAGDKLRAICRYYARFVEDPPIPGGCPILNAAVESSDTHPELRRKVRNKIYQINVAISKILEKGIRKKQIRKKTDVDAFATYFLAVIEGAVMVARLEQDTRSFFQIMKMLDKQIARIEK